MRKPLLALVAFGLMACEGSNPNAAVSPNASLPPATATATAHPATPTPTPAPTATPGFLAGMPVIPVDFSCRLPVVISTQTGEATVLQGGFITFPLAQLSQDPAGRIQRYFQQDLATTATPVLYGSGGAAFYDLAQSRWVPAPASEALPDGSAYAYAQTYPGAGASIINIITVASGSVLSYTLSSVDRPYVEDYNQAGVFIVSPSALGGPGEGIWLLRPGTGQVSQTWVMHQLWMVRDGYAWVARFDPRDKTVWPPSEVAPANSLVRIDLKTGAQTDWYYRAGTYPWMIGIASNDRPVLMINDGSDSEQVLLVDQPGSAGQVVLSSNVGPGDLGEPQADGDRLWFGDRNGIYLFTPAGGFRKVFAYKGDPATAARIEPAGFCL